LLIRVRCHVLKRMHFHPSPWGGKVIEPSVQDPGLFDYRVAIHFHNLDQVSSPPQVVRLTGKPLLGAVDGDVKEVAIALREDDFFRVVRYHGLLPRTGAVPSL
jgi:hypothetical protein